VLVLGLAFKENCPDIRNTKVIDVCRELEEFNVAVEVYDPWVNPIAACKEYGVTMMQELKAGRYDAAVLAVAHNEFLAMGAEGIRAYLKPDNVLFDVKSVLPAAEVSGRL
jgi:UDP-N-acetyl-D-galactosamine dehydrogenase